MIVLVDEEGSSVLSSTGRRFRPAPPVSTNIGGKEWDGRNYPRSRERKHMNTYDAGSERRPAARNPVLEQERGYFNPPPGPPPFPAPRRNGSGPASTPSRPHSGHGHRSQKGGKDGESVADASEFSFSIDATPKAR